MYATEQIEQASAAMAHHDMSAVRKALEVKPSEGKKLIGGPMSEQVHSPPAGIGRAIGVAEKEMTG
jgi:hypothetical protein